MVRKFVSFFTSILKRQVFLDLNMQGLNRIRLFDVPLITNYVRVSNFELIVQEIIDNHIPGNVAEVGVFKGEFAKYINKAFPNKMFYLFDTFEGFDTRDIKIEKSEKFSSGEQDFSNTSVQEVLSKMTFKDKCIIKKGYFPDSLDGLEDDYCFVSLDPDLYKPIYDGLKYFYPRLNKGGYIFIHDYNNSHYPGAKQAVRDFCSELGISYIPITDTWGTAIIGK